VAHDDWFRISAAIVILVLLIAVALRSAPVLTISP
jgi:hypothetical protein